jgi:penicillin-binding protein 1A
MTTKKDPRKRGGAAPPVPSRGRRFLSWAGRWTLRMAVLGGAAVGGFAVLGFLGYQRYIIDEPGAHIEREAIRDIIAQESPVLYRDGKARIGVFFSEEHRVYVPFEQIPTAWVKAIVAAEDEFYWSHPGVDWHGIARAMRLNLRAGKMVAGGSTLTQQTAKNLYYRPDNSLRSKAEEAVNALRLERHHSKEDILEFYANQFHVSANGRGLGIAARYFFDKEVGELDTLECAFLAGMVKGPANYNPFVGKTEDRRVAARERATARTHYVLDRMLDTGAISGADHKALVARDIPFKRGTFRYDTNILIDEVARRLDQAPFPALFAELGIDNPSTAGISVVTTIDQGVQVGATYALWHHLSEAGPLLEGQSVADLRLGAALAPQADPDNPVGVHEFSAAVVERVTKGELQLDLAGTPCKVDNQGLSRMATILARAKKGERSRVAGREDVDALIAGLPAGSVVWASLREAGVCDLELRPELQGAVLVLEQGQARAMVGGNDNRNFNRATTARRQLGSTWKPVLYHAALQLGWSPLDTLDNRSNVHHFEGTWYLPRPDHASEDFVSLSWAGTRSENLASIWLFAHLLDHLSPDRFADVVALVGMARESGLDDTAWQERVRDEWGVISTSGRLPELAFGAARAQVMSELPAEHPDRSELPNLFYGLGLERERARVRGDAKRTRALSGDFTQMELAGIRCQGQAEALKVALGAPVDRSIWDVMTGQGKERPVPAAARFPDLRIRIDGPALELACGPAVGFTPLDAVVLAELAAEGGPELPDVGEVLVPGGLGDGLRLSTLLALRRAMARTSLVLEAASPYDPAVLQYHPDFRMLVSMRYLSALAQRLGVESELPPVLSMPLGAVDITLEEAAGLYQVMLDGQVWSFPGKAETIGGVFGGADVASPDTSTLLIAEIRDRNGQVLYRATPRGEQVTTVQSGRLIGDVLRNVVRSGTGRSALGAVTLGGRPVPVAGKTGTTNSYKNAAFSGFVPRVHDGAWRWGHGFTVAAYVGYDDNRPMTRGAARLQGASGALPAWVGTAQALADLGLLGQTPPASDEFEVEEGLVVVEVDPIAGLRVTSNGSIAEEADGAVGAAILVRSEDQDGVAEDRSFEPFVAQRRGHVAPAPQVAPAVEQQPTLPPTEPPAAEVVEPSPVQPVVDGAAIDGGAVPEEGQPAVPDELRDVWVDDMDAPLGGGAAAPDTGVVPRIAPPER